MMLSFGSHVRHVFFSHGGKPAVKRYMRLRILCSKISEIFVHSRRILSYPSTKGWKSFEWITRKCWVISKWAVGWRGGCLGVNCNLPLFSVELLPTKLVLGGHAALPDRSQSGQRFLWPAWRNSPLRVLSALFSHRCLDLSPILRMILWILQIW